MDTKICSKCKIEQPLSEFSPNKRTRDGLQSVCKSCRRIQVREIHRKQRAEFKLYDRLLKTPIPRRFLRD